jgi:hypothetical protein
MSSCYKLRALSMDDYDAMVGVEEALIERLPAGSEIDGHDVGSGEINIFIHTNDPARTFEEVRSVLCHHEVWANIRAAYRHLEATEYIVIRPKWLTVFEIT